MKYTAILALAALCFDSATASPVDISARQNRPSGTGPYAPATYKTDSTLRDHTIYYPTNPPSTTKLPVFIWGNGACSTQGLSNRALLQQIASHGFLAISEGGPQGSGAASTRQTMKAAIDWVTQNAGKGSYANVDASRIMAAGFSCGGVEAMENIWDERVDTIGVVSSGLLSNYTAAGAWRKPVVFVMGGSGDVAYQNAERDYRNMASGVPVWKGNIPVGHGGTLGDQNGGRFGKAILNWLLWTLKGDANAAKYFTAGGSSADGWQVEQKSLNLLKPFV